jgi:hypothetical protein
MSNQIATIKSNALKLTKMAAADLNDQLQFFQAARKFDMDEFKGDANGNSPGDTVSIRVPAHYTVKTDSFDLTNDIQDIKETWVSAKLDLIGTIGTALSTQELTHDVNLGKVYDRFLKQQISDLAASLEARMLEKAAQACPNIVGTPSSNIHDTDLVLSAGEIMAKGLAPMALRDRFLLGDSTSMRHAVNARKGLFNGQEALAKMFKYGSLGQADNFNWMQNELVYRHTNGADVAFAVEATVSPIAEGMSLLGVDGVTSGATIKAGTKFTVPGVYRVHPQTKKSLGILQTFTVLEDVTETAANSVILKIWPAIYTATSGSLQNVTALPTDEDAVTVLTGDANATHTHSLAFHKEAYRVGTAKLVIPNNAEFAAQHSEKGMNIAIVRDWDQTKRRMVTRIDVLGLIVPVRPSWATVLTS